MDISELKINNDGIALFKLMNKYKSGQLVLYSIDLYVLREETMRGLYYHFFFAVGVGNYKQKITLDTRPISYYGYNERTGTKELTPSMKDFIDAIPQFYSNLMM